MVRMVVAGLLSYGVSAAVLLLFVPIYGRLGVVSRLRRDRWGRRVVPLCGGVGIVAGLASGLLFAPYPKPLFLLGVVVALFLLGTFDDVGGGISPVRKLVASFVLVSPLIAGGIYVNILFPYLGVVLSLLWFGGMAHAMNLLDNMDGIACGVGMVVSGGMAYAFWCAGDLWGGVMASSLCGACAGVLLFNFPPARLFLGDAGSLPLGAALAALSVWATWREASGVLVSVLFPLLVLSVPLLDTLFVVTTRRLRGRGLFVGGRDHLSHRLAEAGLTERVIFLLFLSTAALSTIGAVLGRRSTLLMLLCFLSIIGGGVVGGLFLSRFGPGAGRLRRLFSAKIHIIVVALDMVFFAVAFLLAYIVRFGVGGLSVYHKALTIALPVVVSAKVATFFLGGAYEEFWSLSRLTRCSVLASLTVIAALAFAVRLKDISRVALVLDFFFSLLLSALARIILRRLAHADREG